MVSPKPKQSTLSNFKVISKPAPSGPNKQSPKEKTTKQPSRKSPKDKSSVASTVESKDCTTPVWGVKRKSDFTSEEGGTPVKQLKIPEGDKNRVDDSRKGRTAEKVSVVKPTLESMLIRNPKAKSSKRVSAVDSEEKKDTESSEKVEIKASSILELPIYHSG
jgi:hypothetical protein